MMVSLPTHICVARPQWVNVGDPVNIFGPRQKGRHFPNDTSKCIFVKENFWALNRISLKYVPHGKIGNLKTLVQKMAWRRLGYKPLSKPVMAYLAGAYMRHSASMSLVCEVFVTCPLGQSGTAHGSKYKVHQFTDVVTRWHTGAFIPRASLFSITCVFLNPEGEI